MLLNLKELKKKYFLEITGVIHIGAHVGQEITSYDECDIKNIVFFEPVPETFLKLKSNIGDKAKLYNVALGNFEGEIEMNIEYANEGQSSSILKPKIHLIQYPQIQFVDRIKVKVKKLDDYDHLIGNYNFINIDVQGYELEVFKGAENFLNSIDYIMTEVNNDEVYENCAKINELDDFLKKYNFERVETYWAGGTWGDAFYIKRK